MNLYRRNPASPDCPWTARFSVRCVAYQWSTQTTDKKLAATRAKDYRQKIISGEFNLADSMKQRGGAAKIEEIIKVYDTLPAPIEHTRKRNVAALKAVLKASKLSVDDRVDRLGAHIVTAYQSAMLKAHPGSNSAMVSANSNVRMARSVLSKAALLTYRQTLTVPKEPVEGFFNAPFLKVARPMKMLPSADAMAKAVIALKDKPYHFAAYNLGRYGGLRAGEIMNAKRSWLDGTTLRIGAFPDEFKTKSGAERRIALSAEVVKILLAGDDPVWLCGPRRREIVGRELNAILRDAGFTDAKPTHSLRRMALSNVFTTQGAEAAQEFAGHSSIVVTQQAYSHLLKPTEAIAFTG